MVTDAKFKFQYGADVQQELKFSENQIWKQFLCLLLFALLLVIKNDLHNLLCGL